MLPKKCALLLIFFALLTIAASAKKKEPPPPPKPAKMPSPAVTDEYIHKQFGDGCSLISGPQQWTGDLDGDGVDDLVVAARCKNPLVDQGDYHFTVIDPYDSFLGFGNVKVTSTFASDEPERRGVCLLIVHGAEKGGWQAEKPKAKYLVINTPYRSLSVKKLDLRKKTILGVFMEESGEGEDTSSVIFWDGKKYRYQIVGANFE